MGVFKPNVKNIKTILLKLLQNCNQILQNDKERLVLFVGGPDMCQMNPRWRTATILQKK